MNPFAILMLRKEPYYRRAAFEAGLKRLGYDVVTPKDSRLVSPRTPFDLFITWNLKAGSEEDVARRWEKRGGVAIVTENAYLQREDKSRYAVSTHGHNGSGWFPVGSEDRFSALGFALKDMQSGSTELVCGQRGIGSSLMRSPPQWAEKKLQDLRARKINAKLRAHPGNFVPKVSLEQDLQGCRVCHIWSSGAGVRALVNGVPVKHYAPHWICEGWEKDRPAALNRMAHGQWSVDEIASGEPFARMRDAGWGPSWA